MEIKSNAGNDFDLGARLWLEFNRPVDKAGLENLHISEKVDTLYQPLKFTLEEDSLKIRRIYIDASWKAGQEYLLTLDSASVNDIYGRHNNKLEKKFKVRQEEFYGKIMLNVSGVQGQVILQLYKSDNGKYKFRAILDTNGNGIWDTGLYLKNQQPEEIVYLPVEISVKQNFDIEQEFNLLKPYKDESDK